MHVEFLLEEPSAEAFLHAFLPRLLPGGVTWALHPFHDKPTLLTELPFRLKGYGKWLPPDWRIVVLVDEDRDDCKALKRVLENAARAANLGTRSAPTRKGQVSVLNRIAIEELEAWFFGDTVALADAYPGVPPTLGMKERFRDPDRITGGTWETIERVLQRAGHFPGGLGKIELARELGMRLDAGRNSSRSFRAFVEGVKGLVA